jgi:transketolase
MSWERWVGTDGIAIGLRRFGASAPYKEIYEHLGISAAKVVEAAKQLTAS